MKTSTHLITLVICSLIANISLAGPGGTSGGTGIIPPGTGGQEIRSIDLRDFRVIQYEDSQMPVIELGNGAGSGGIIPPDTRGQEIRAIEIEQIELINDLMESGLFEELDLKLRDGSRLRIQY